MPTYTSFPGVLKKDSRYADYMDLLGFCGSGGEVQLIRVFINALTRKMLEGKHHWSLEMVFPIVKAFVDRVLEMGRIAKMTMKNSK